ncbi:MAG: hypothetical protein HZB51_19820 [Chloroflexi bacterium]|nr:hypothetical protein [Chloroflexota bacterium]
MQQKFRVLRIVAIIWKVLAWLVLVLSILGGCGTLAMGLLAGGGAAARSSDMLGIGLTGVVGGIVTALAAIFFGILYFVFLYAFAELVDVMLALEENTRATAEQLKSLAAKT